ncbi:hypothetical protein EHS25_007729 [Saitozyma podzolica]|uniref:SAP domain-containing protein n=1 Tax=Saitozyma podzolica TaxID=1890683 RepID=A0A427YQJ9_9TREE|nr:hypothetical protein EHS25_007729 [Saitozyma podzolica]
MIADMPKPSKKATVDELRGGLAKLGLDTKGKKETLWRRLLTAFHRAKSTPSPETEAGAASQVEKTQEVHGPTRKKWGKQPYRSFLCFDVEATCSGGKDFHYPNEIIEFPVVLLQWVEADDDDVDTTSPSSSTSDTASTSSSRKRLKRVDTFHSYVRPTWRPELGEFCTNLTGITQDMVDSAPTFPEMLVQLEKWLDGHGLRDDDYLIDALWVTDGPWDLRDFIPKQLHISPLSPPRYPRYFLGPYLNIKQAVQTVLSEEYRRAEYARTHPDNPPNQRALSRIGTGRYLSRAEREGGKGPRFYGTIPQMLEMLQLGEFEGRRHSGLDDAGNVARILIALAEKDVLIEPNGRLHHHKNARKWPWMAERGVVVWEEWMRGVGPAGDKDGKEGEGSQDKDKAGEEKEGEGVAVVEERIEGEEVVGTLRENGEGTSSSGTRRAETGMRVGTGTGTRMGT